MTAAELDIERKRVGRGFAYYYQTGRKVHSQRVLRRIENLVIPPNWQNVKIAKSASADLQATGYDAKQRKQYIYHDKWHQQRQREKFARLSEFGLALPDFRRLCWEWVEQPKWTPQRSLALVCLLLDHTGLRAGNRQYTQQNNTYGLTTLRRRHFVHDEQGVHLSFIGKHNKEREVTVDDPRLAELVSESAEARGYALFRYTDEQGQWHDIDSDDVNAFIHDNLDKQFSAKDFRTWAASRYAIISLPELETVLKKHRQRKWASTLTKHVAQMLGNTPSVCRQYYLHPKLYESVENKEKRRFLLEQSRKCIPGELLDDHAITSVEKVLFEVIDSE